MLETSCAPQRKKHRLLSLPEKVIDRKVPAKGFPSIDFHVMLADEADVILQNLPGQPVIRDTHGEHTSAHRQGFEYRHRGSPPPSIISRNQSPPPGPPPRH